MEHYSSLFNLKSIENVSENMLDRILEINVKSETFSETNVCEQNNQNNLSLDFLKDFSLSSSKSISGTVPFNNKLPVFSNTISFGSTSSSQQQQDADNGISPNIQISPSYNCLQESENNYVLNSSEEAYNEHFRNIFAENGQQLNLTSTPNLHSSNNLNQLYGVHTCLPSNNTGIPNSIVNLYKSIKYLYSDFSFVYALSAQMCQDIVPMNSFIILKIALILSLASTNDIIEDSSMPIPIIAIGKETSIINEIMIKFRNVSKRFINGFQANTSFVGIEFLKNNNMIEGGLMFLARGGVLYFGNWSGVKSFNEGKVSKIIEYGKTNLEFSNKQHRIHCAVWSYWIGEPKKCKENMKLIKFLEIFGIPIIVDDNESSILCNFILEKALGKVQNKYEDELSLSENDIKLFLTIVSRRSVIMSSEASNLLQKYFVICRKERPGYLTQRAFTTLYQFSESFAKLSLRYEVLKIDVIGAIFIAENSLNRIIGPGFRKFFPPEFQPANNIIENTEIYIRNFELWLDNYIQRIL
ncbi:uncharacterized protein LOC129605154 [Condylostylus longicornis]|uniref:uncharacterized protein LOC129605154 n=1 Tax=Condylostylus longicornis TaxID=2530218 RepID=UPI00244D9B63|nr:uncharacterized protein LOC129605154 [Condylostylus longicornis]